MGASVWTRDREELFSTGLALASGLLAWAVFGGRPGLAAWALGITVASLVAPWLLYPAALVWTPLAGCLRWCAVRSGLILAFYLIVTPLGLVRRRLGYDPMRRRQWKNGEGSVFTERGKAVTAEQLADPY